MADCVDAFLSLALTYISHFFVSVLCGMFNMTVQQLLDRAREGSAERRIKTAVIMIMLLCVGKECERGQGGAKLVPSSGPDHHPFFFRLVCFKMCFCLLATSTFEHFTVIFAIFDIPHIQGKVSPHMKTVKR
jgi:hypothetical protein